MKKIPPVAQNILNKHHFVVVSSFNQKRAIHTSLKAVVDIDPKGKIFILDLYKGVTYNNIKQNPKITLTIVDEHKFLGYSIQGRARILKKGSFSKKILDIWHEKLAKRIARRIIRHAKELVPGRDAVPEAGFPLPEYLMQVDVDKVMDLAPGKPKRRG